MGISVLQFLAEFADVAFDDVLVDIFVEDAVSAIIPPEDAPRMLAEWSENPGRFTKIMVQFH